MLLSELKAVLARTSKVAMYAKDIEAALPNAATTRSRWGRDICPTGLIKGEVLQVGVKWIENRQITGCDLRDYKIEHKNGVRVRVNPEDWLGEGWHSTPAPRHTAWHGGDKVGYDLDVIVSHKAIFTSWDDYALKMAEREKSQAEADAKQLALYEPQAALMGITVDELRARNDYHSNQTYLNAEWRNVYELDEDGEYKRDKNGSRISPGEVGVISITLERAEKILADLHWAGLVDWEIKS